MDYLCRLRILCHVLVDERASPDGGSLDGETLGRVSPGVSPCVVFWAGCRHVYEV